MRLTGVEEQVGGLQQDVATMAAAMREGFQQIREEMRFGFSGMRQEMRALTDVVQRIYTEHGQRLKDLEDHLTNHPTA